MRAPVDLSHQIRNRPDEETLELRPQRNDAVVGSEMPAKGAVTMIGIAIELDMLH